MFPVYLWFLTRVLSTFAHEAVGALGIRHSPRPLGRNDMHDFGRNAPREREAMSGEKISVVIARACGRSSIPETSMMEPRGRGVLVTPHARGMTPVRAPVHLTYAAT